LTENGIKFHDKIISINALRISVS